MRNGLYDLRLVCQFFSCDIVSAIAICGSDSLLEQRFYRTRIWCAYADSFSHSRRNVVYRDRCGDVLRFHTVAHKDDGKRYEACTGNICLMIIFVEQFPARCHVDDDIAGEGGVEASPHFRDIRIAGHQAVTGVDIGYAGTLYEEFGAVGEYLRDGYALLFDEAVVKVHLIVETGFYIASLSVDGPKLDIE